MVSLIILLIMGTLITTRVTLVTMVRQVSMVEMNLVHRQLLFFKFLNLIFTIMTQIILSKIYIKAC